MGAKAYHWLVSSEHKFSNTEGVGSQEESKRAQNKREVLIYMKKSNLEHSNILPCSKANALTGHGYEIRWGGEEIPGTRGADRDIVARAIFLPSVTSGKPRIRNVSKGI
jgi:hypothetical protein